MEPSARAVIIGAGVVGTAVAEHLAGLGWTDLTVIDQGPLFPTGGSTSHAPGGVFQTNPSRTMTAFAAYTVQHFCELRHEGRPCFHQVGSLEVARSPERVSWLHLRQGLAAAWGLEANVIDPEAARKLVPLLDPGAIRAALHVPSDGVARQVAAAEAMAARATAQGGFRFHGGVQVTGFDIVDGHVRGVATTAGPIRTELVVSCAGMWGPKLGRLAGVSVPLLPMQHQLVWTEPLAALRGETDEVRHPLMRDQDVSMYYRQRGETYAVGSYQHVPLPVRAEAILDPADAPRMPSIMAFTPEHFEPAWRDAQTLVPALKDAAIADSFNGLFSFTPDGNPLLGESREVKGFWVAEAIWITHSAGVGRAVAEWLDGGNPGLDLRECDLNRFERFATSPSYVHIRSCQQYDEVYDIVHPQAPPERPRPLRVSPYHHRQLELGAHFLEASGWERPHWFEANAPLADGLRLPEIDDWAGRYWSPIVAAEHLACRDRVAMHDVTSLKRAEITGPGALSLLQRLTTGNLDRRPGYVTYTLMLDSDAGIRSDITVARLGANRFQVGLNGPRDIAYLERHLPSDGSAQVRDVTGGTCCIGLWGPRARDVLQAVSPDDVSDSGFGFFRCREIFVAEVPVTALRLSYVGELGWELYASADLGLRLWDVLWEAGQEHGVVAAGRGALLGMRLEKGYRMWGVDMWSEHDPYEAGLGFAVKLDKLGFSGRDALLRRREAPRRRLTSITVDDGCMLLGKEPVLAGGETCGFITAAAYGCSLNRSIGYAWVPPELAAPGTALEIQYRGERHPATTVSEPLFDPEMRRMRG
ncbi:MAG: FAD-dependent oxidoreductase [Candidatus Dormibacteraeota bacterium]|nr:FAD-dependent oxidoreductase [Candidatus Dormibacteraeota bacterium]